MINPIVALVNGQGLFELFLGQLRLAGRLKAHAVVIGDGGGAKIVRTINHFIDSQRCSKLIRASSNSFSF